MQTTRTQLIAISDLHSNEAQPENRHKNVKDLRQSIETYGLFYEPIVSKNGTGYIIVDGHRRIEACRQLGIQEISCKVIQRDDITATEAFGIVNKDTKRLSNKDFMLGYSRGGMIPARMMQDIMSLTDKHGKKVIDLAVKLDISIASIRKYSNMAERAGIARGREFCDFVKWINRHRMHTTVQFYLVDKNMDIPLPHLVQCFKEDKPFIVNVANN